MAENEKHDKVNEINFEDTEDFEINSEDIIIKRSNEDINNDKDILVKNEELNTEDLQANNKIEESDALNKVCPQCKNECGKEDLFCNKCGYKFEVHEIETRFLCPKCGHEYTSEDLFCKKCGYKLDQTNKCPYCGAKYELGDLFCGECGKRLLVNRECTSPNSSTVSNTEFCRFCKTSIPKGVKKCPHCGEWIEGGSHFGCGSIIMIATIILGIISALGAFSFEIPWLGEVTGVVGVIFVIIVWLYLLPSLIADSRGHESKFGIFLVNLFFGWSVIGWFVALILAFSGKRR